MEARRQSLLRASMGWIPDALRAGPKLDTATTRRRPAPTERNERGSTGLSPSSVERIAAAVENLFVLLTVETDEDV